MDDSDDISQNSIASVDLSGANPTVVVSGDVDFHTAPQIVEAVTGLLTGGYSLVRICLANVEFMDSTGISSLLNSVRLAKGVGARITLVSPSQQLMHILEISSFKPFFEFEGAPLTAAPGLPAEVAPMQWEVCEFSVPCHPALVADIRRRVSQVAEALPFTSEQMHDIKLAVGEAAANACRYGSPMGTETIYVRCVGDSNGLTVEITDMGPGFDPDLIPEPVAGNLEPNGRGIFFMKLSMDEVQYERMNPGMRVRMVKYLTTPL